MSSPYASAMGRLTVRSAAFLRRETFVALTGAKDAVDIAKILETTVYSPDLTATSATYAGEQMLEVAINRLFVRRCRGALDATPFAGKATVSAYLRRFDVQNIALILSAKAQGRPVSEAEMFLISSREVPAGLFAGAMTLNDFRQLLAQPTLEGVAQQLVRFGYAGALLPRLEEYQRTHDIFPLLLALDKSYYAELLRSIVYFQGDEWNVRRFVRSEIDVRNALVLLKGKDAGLPIETVLDRFLDGGEFPRSAATDAFGAPTVPELVALLQPRFPSIVEGLPGYQSGRTLTGFEVALTRERAAREILRMRSYPLSGAILFTYLMRAELERVDLRRVVYGRRYGFPPATVLDQLVVPKLRGVAG